MIQKLYGTYLLCIPSFHFEYTSHTYFLIMFTQLNLFRIKINTILFMVDNFIGVIYCYQIMGLPVIISCILLIEYQKIWFEINRNRNSMQSHHYFKSVLILLIQSISDYNFRIFYLTAFFYTIFIIRKNKSAMNLENRNIYIHSKLIRIEATKKTV